MTREPSRAISIASDLSRYPQRDLTSSRWLCGVPAGMSHSCHPFVTPCSIARSPSTYTASISLSAANSWTIFDPSILPCASKVSSIRSVTWTISYELSKAEAATAAANGAGSLERWRANTSRTNITRVHTAVEATNTRRRLAGTKPLSDCRANSIDGASSIREW